MVTSFSPLSTGRPSHLFHLLFRYFQSSSNRCLCQLQSHPNQAKPPRQRQKQLTFAMFTSFSFVSFFTFAIAAIRCCVLTAAVRFLFAAIAAKSAPTIPCWCFTVRREYRFATSSVIPFLLMHPPIHLRPLDLAQVLTL
jgi:hypothetical protein